MRFVPYLGALIAAAFPLALAAAVDPGWVMVVETAVLFIVVETIMGQVVEPQLFGHTTGMSPLAIIVAAMFWTLIWGSPGLLLSTPLTACLVVLGRHVEYLNFIELLLGDKPALSPVLSFYQRVLASDPDEVTFQAETLLKDCTLLDYYEDVAMPALALAQADVAREILDSNRLAAICATVERVVEDLADHADPVPVPAVEGTEKPAAVDAAIVGNKAKALCLAGRTMLDQAGCAILAQLLQRKGIDSSFAGPELAHHPGHFRFGRLGRRRNLPSLFRPPEHGPGPLFGKASAQEIPGRPGGGLPVGRRERQGDVRLDRRRRDRLDASLGARFSRRRHATCEGRSCGNGDWAPTVCDCASRLKTSPSMAAPRAALPNSDGDLG